MLVLVTDMYNNTVYININQVCVIKEENQIKHDGKECNYYVVELANDGRIHISDREASHLIGVMHIR